MHNLSPILSNRPEYQYEGSYDPIMKDNSYHYCYFGVRVVDENGNMSLVKVSERLE